MGKKKGGAAAATSDAAAVPPLAKPEAEAAEVEEPELVEAAAAAAAGKKKRKKRKKKAGAAAGAAEAEGGDDDSEDEEFGAKGAPKAGQAEATDLDISASKLGPLAPMMRECVRRGHSRQLAEEVLSAMFDKGYDYDNEELVLNLVKWAAENGTQHLENGYRIFAASPSPDSAPQPPAKVEAPTPVAAPAAPAAAQAQAPAPAPVEDDGWVQPQQKKDKKVAAAASPTPAVAPAAAPPAPAPQPPKTQQQPAAPQAPPAKAGPPKPAAPAPAPVPAKSPTPAHALAGLTLEAKLEAAAANADVGEALRMLAASALREEDAPALRPALLASKAFEAAAGGLLRVALDQHALPKAGGGKDAQPLPAALAEELGDLISTLVGGKGAAAAKEAALAAVAQARALEAQARAQGRTLSGPARARLADALGGALKACFAARKGPGGGKAAARELEALESRLRQASGSAGQARPPLAKAGLRELLEQRERHAGAMELQAACCRLLVQQATGQAVASAEAEREGQRRARLAEAARGLLVDAVVEDLVGLSAGQLSAKKRDMESARSQLAMESGRMEAELRPLAEEAARKKAEAAALAEQKAALERQLAEVEAKLGAATAAAEAAEGAMGKRRAAMEAALAERDRGLQEGLRLLKAAEAAEELGGRVAALGAALLQAPGAGGAAGDSAATKKLRQRVRAFGLALEPYLQVQVRLYETLAARKDKAEEERGKLLAQAEHFGGIGLAENKRDLEAKAAEASAHAAEDQGAMAQLAADAEGLYLSFRAAVEAAGGVGADWMVRGEGAEVSAVLGGIKQALDRLNLARDWLPGLAPAKPPARAPVAPSPAAPAGPIQPPQQQQSSLAALGPTPASLAVPSAGPGPLLGAPAAATVAATKPAPQQQRPPRTPGAILQPGAMVGGGQPASSSLQQPPLPQQAQAPSPPAKFSWASRVASAAPGGGAATGSASSASASSSPQGQKSLVQIQEEERQSQLTEENLRRLEQGKATGSAAPARVRGGIGSSEAEVNSMTDRTLGAATVSSEGMAELAAGGGASVVTAVGAIPPPGLGQVGGEELSAAAGGPPPGLDVNGL